MKAMILAAGKGSRMGKITLKTPKPLMTINNTTLIEHNIERVKKAGITEIMINVAWLSDKIIDYIGDGVRYGVKINYSIEGKEPIGTGRGINKVLDYFDNQNFWICNSDIYCDYEINNIDLDNKFLGHLILVNNPKHHSSGDFALEGNKVLPKSKNNSFTYSGISYLSPKLFEKYNFAALEDILLKATKDMMLVGEYYNGNWTDVGTPDRLNLINANK